MLAGKVDEAKLTYPLMASPKLDGVRAGNVEGAMRSRSLKPFGNEYTQMRYSTKLFHGFDGELILGEPTAPDVYRKTNSAIARIEGSPQLTWWVFDDFSAAGGFATRYGTLRRRLQEISDHAQVFDIRLLEHEIITDSDDLDYFEQHWVNQGYEGIMLRSFLGPYKFGRSTTSEGILLKLKRFDDGEALVIGVEEEMHNGNVATTSELGRTKRSSHKENKTGKGTMGALVVRGIGGPFDGVEFKIGTGFTAADRARTDWLGTIVKYKYFAVGVKDKPRHPVYAGDRMKEDM